LTKRTTQTNRAIAQIIKLHPECDMFGPLSFATMFHAHLSGTFADFPATSGQFKAPEVVTTPFHKI
jgi:hypothetical protein